MHLSFVHTVIFFAGLVYCQANDIPPANASNPVGAAVSNVESTIQSLIGSLTSPSAGLTSGSPPIPSDVQGGTVPSPAHNEPTINSITFVLSGFDSATPTGPVTTHSVTTTAVSTTRGVASGAAVPNATNATITSTATASPTPSHTSGAAQLRAFAGGAGILLLLGMLSGL